MLIHPDLQTHLEGEVLTLCRLWLIVRKDGVIKAFTDCYQDLKINAITVEYGNTTLNLGVTTFKSRHGFESSSIEGDDSASPNNNELMSFFSDAEINYQEVRNGRYSHALIEERMVNYLDLPVSLPSTKAPILNRGNVGEINNMGNETFKFEQMGRSNVLKRKRGKTTEYLCPYNFGDADCKKNITPYTHNVTITSTSAEGRVLTLSGLPGGTNPPYFEHGECLITGGANDGFRVRIHSQPSATTIRLLNSAPAPIVPGTTATVIKGCPKTPTFCEAESNKVNYGGFDFLPGRDTYASGKNQT